MNAHRWTENNLAGHNTKVDGQCTERLWAVTEWKIIASARRGITGDAKACTCCSATGRKFTWRGYVIKIKLARRACSTPNSKKVGSKFILQVFREWLCYSMPCLHSEVSLKADKYPPELSDSPYCAACRPASTRLIAANKTALHRRRIIVTADVSWYVVEDWRLTIERMYWWDFKWCLVVLLLEHWQKD